MSARSAVSSSSQQWSMRGAAASLSKTAFLSMIFRMVLSPSFRRGSAAVSGKPGRRAAPAGYAIPAVCLRVSVFVGCAVGVSVSFRRAVQAAFVSAPASVCRFIFRRRSARLCRLVRRFGLSVSVRSVRQAHSGAVKAAHRQAVRRRAVAFLRFACGLLSAVRPRARHRPRGGSPPPPCLLSQPRLPTAYRG